MPSPSPLTSTPRALIAQIADYDMLMWGECLDRDREQDLRTLAQVFDLDPSGLSLAKLWGELRPLVAERAMRGAS